MGDKIMYDTILARSFSRYDQKKLRYGAFLGCLLIALSFCTVFKPYLGPLTLSNKRPSMDIGPKMLRLITVVNETRSSEIEMVVSENTGGSNETISSNDAVNFKTTVIPMVNESFDTNLTTKNVTVSSNTVPSADEEPVTSSSKVPEFNYTTPMGNDITSSNTSVSILEINNENSTQQFRGFAPEKIIKPICNIEERTEFCEINGDVRIHGKSSTVFMLVSPSSQNSSWIIQPYARKGDEGAMSHVTKWSVKSGVMDGYRVLPRCDRNHEVPAIVFSLGGYAGNNFHDYTDIVIPLYLTSRQFNGEVKFLITDKNPFWTNKFKTILRKLSRYEVIEVDNKDQVHCFPTVIVGFKRIRD